MSMIWALVLWAYAEAASPASALCPFHPERAAKLFAHDLQHSLGLEAITEIFREKELQYGPCRKLVKGRKKQWLMHTPQGVLPLELHWKKGKITDFFFAPPKLKEDSFARVEEFGRKVFPRFSLLLTRDGEKVFAVNSTSPLNVSRSAQLFLLRALRREVAAGRKRLDQVALLDRKDYSFGPLQQWPVGTALSLDALRGFAQIERDTAASDLLLQVVGREKVEAEGAHLKPFLSFRQYHQLLAHAKPEELKEGVDLAALATKVAERGPEPESIAGHPAFAGRLGWFATTEELCRVLGELRDDPMLRRTMASEGAALALGEDWRDVISVQAREAGVAQSILLMRSREGKSYCLAITANGEKEIPETSFYDLNGRVLALVRSGELEK